MANYAFGAGGLKLGERVEILTTGQRGILINEIIHISGCNTYQILLPNVLVDGRMKCTNRDYLMLRRLDSDESMFDAAKKLTDENSFSSKSACSDADYIRAAINAGKEFIPEIDDATGIEDIAVMPGMEVWNSVYGKTMIISYICREIFSKELVYGAVYMAGDKEEIALSHVSAFVPLERKFDLPSTEKHGPLFEDSRDRIASLLNFM